MGEELTACLLGPEFRSLAPRKIRAGIAAHLCVISVVRR